MDFECQCLYIVAKQFDDLLESLQPSQILRLFLVYYSLDVVLLLATGILPEKEPVHFHFMYTMKAAEPESIRRWLEGLACINSKKWDKGVPGGGCIMAS